MFSSPIRRAQLIAPFGVGALLMTKEGVSLIGAGLDHWFDETDDQSTPLDCEQFYIEEWRLQRSLDVDFFDCRPTSGGRNGIGRILIRISQFRICGSRHGIFARDAGAWSRIR